MIHFIKPEEKYIQSYWETFGTICKEGIYLGALEPFPLESTIDLEVRSANARAIHVYTQLGFRTTNIIKGGFVLTDGATPEDLVQMSLSLIL